MTDTAQPGLAAENVALDDAAHAFKVHLGQAPADEQPRDDRGRFAAQGGDAEAEEIEAEAAPEEVADDADIDVEPDGQEEAADEAQPDPVPPPASWSKEDADLWASLPPEAQAKIAEREGQREAAVNQKFQEAANVRKANEAVIAEANANLRKYAAAADQVMSLIQPQRPNPQDFLTQEGFDQASFAQAQFQYEQTTQLLGEIAQQRQQAAAQLHRDQEAAEAAAMAEIETAARPGFIADVPDIGDPQKAPGVLRDIVSYAIRAGIPETVFTDPENAKRVSSAELHIAWKAMQYDLQRAAQAKVKANPKPEAKKPQPAVRPGVATPRGAQERAKLSGAMDRLAKSGSIDDGAAVLKQLFKGR